MARKPVSYLAGSVLLGTAIGAVVGLLAAPRSGSELRNNLKERADDARKRVDEARHRVEEAGRSLKALPKGGLERLTNLPKALREARRSAASPGTRVTVEGRENAEALPVKPFEGIDVDDDELAEEPGL